MAGSEGGASLSCYTNLTFEDLFDLLYCPDLERYPELLGNNIPDDGELLVYFYKIVEDVTKGWDETYVSYPEVFYIENDELKMGWPRSNEKIEYMKLKIKECKEWRNEN